MFIFVYQSTKPCFKRDILSSLVKLELLETLNAKGALCVTVPPFASISWPLYAE